MISIVVPTYNRSYMLEKVYKEVNTVMKDNQIPYELIFVNDCSTDDTELVLSQLCKEYKEVKGITLANNYGQQNATLAGIRYSSYPNVVTCDDDLSYNPQSIIALFNEMNKGYDLVYGVPRRSKANKIRKIGTFVKEFAFLLILKKPFGVRLTSFRIMNSLVVDHVIHDKNAKVYISASALQIKPRIENIAIDDLTKGEPTNYTLLKLTRVLMSAMTNYSFLGPIYRVFSKKEQYSIKEFHI